MAEGPFLPVHLIWVFLFIFPVFTSIPVRAQTPETGSESLLRFHPIEQIRDTLTGPLSRNVDIGGSNLPLEHVLREIARQTGLIFVFRTDLIAAQPRRTYTIEHQGAISALQSILEGTELAGYLTPDGKILITRKRKNHDEIARLHLAQAPRQTVRGRVLDRDTRVPLPGAHVVVLNTDPLVGTATLTNGEFVIRDVPLGRLDIQFTFIGYEPVIIPGVLVSSGKETVVEVLLKGQIITGEEVLVYPVIRKDQPLNEMAVVSARSFSVEETRRYAGGLDDPARMAGAFAGVTGSAGLGDNALIIRGNAPKGVLWRLEGVEIPNPNHFAGLSTTGGGGLTLFSGQILTNSDFFSGAFPAEYGNALAGVFDMNFRSGNPQKREHAVQASILGLDLSSEGPFTLEKSSTYLFNYRYSTLTFLMPLLPTDSDLIQYQDLSFKLDFPTRRRGRFEVWGIGGFDRQKMSEEPDSTRWEYETWDRLNLKLNLGVGASGVSHTLPLNEKSFLRSYAAFTVNHTVSDQWRLDDHLILQEHLFIYNTTGRFILGSFLNRKFSNRHVNRTGFNLQQLFYDYDLRAAIDDVPPAVPIARESGTSTLFQFYTQSKLNFSKQFELNVGVHSQYFALTGHTTFEPRVGLRWFLDDRQALSLGYGLHSQIEDLRMYFIQHTEGPLFRHPNKKLGFSRANHLVLGYDRALGSNSRLKLETYYQYLFDIPVISDSSYSLINWEQNWEFYEALSNEGLGVNYGIEATLERFFVGGYYYLLTGSLFDSRYRGGDDIWRSTRFDQEYAINVLFGREFSMGRRNNLLGINGRVLLMGGRRRSPIDQAASRQQQAVVFDEYRAFEEREPAVFLVDLTLTYRLNRSRFAEIWALQVKNLLGAKDTYPDYNFKTKRVEQVKEGFPVPVLSYKIEF